MLSALNAGDTAWMLFCTALVFLMVPGLAFFYGGLGSQRNVLTLLTQGFMAVCLVSLQWTLFGYSLSFGPDHNGWIGTLAQAGLRGVGTDPNIEYAGTIPSLAFMLYHAMVAAFTPLIFLGAFSERIKFSSFCVFVLLWTTLVYDPVAHWVWSVGGFLRSSGVIDFAGGTVVHLCAGMSALAMGLVLGKSGTSSPADSSSSGFPLAVFGAVLLWLGWFGFNGGHALTAGGLSASALMVTHMAAVAAAVVWAALDGILTKQFSLLGLLTGAIVGLVAVTPAAGSVNLLGALGIGVGASIIVYASFVLLERKFGYNDSLFLVCVFGIGGVFGVLCSGPFHIQARAVLAVALYAFVMTYLLLKFMDYVVGLRLPETPSQESPH